jgi:hypothetical protein
MKAAWEALDAIRPQDVAEGMLAVQMVATHSAALECLRRAALPDQTPAVVDMSLRHAGRLMTTYLRQLEVLDRRRGSRPSPTTVKYDVNVESGGQAVVGTVHPGPLPQRPTEEGSAAETVQPAAARPGPVEQPRPETPWWLREEERERDPCE